MSNTFLKFTVLKKKQEFITLKQGRMSILEYEEQFIALSTSAPELVCAEDAKYRRFEQGLDLSIRCRVSSSEITRYEELVNKSKIMECDVKEYADRREQFKKRKFISRDGASRQRSSKTTTTVEQSRAHTSLGGEGPIVQGGMGSFRGRGS